MIIKQTGCGIDMVRVLLLNMDKECIDECIAKYGARDVYVAIDATVVNQQNAQLLGLDRYALVGVDVDRTLYELCDCCKTQPAPAKKAAKPKKVEAKKDDKPKSE